MFLVVFDRGRGWRVSRRLLGGDWGQKLEQKQREIGDVLVRPTVWIRMGDWVFRRSRMDFRHKKGQLKDDETSSCRCICRTCLCSFWVPKHRVGLLPKHRAVVFSDEKGLQPSGLVTMIAAMSPGSLVKGE